MQKPHFNFANQSVWKKSFIDYILLAFAILLGVIFYVLYQFKLNQWHDLQAMHNAQPVKPIKQVNPQLAVQLQQMQSVQQALNAPWMETFNVLEMVKQHHPNVQFLTVEPNLNRAEINIKVKAEAFSEVTALLESLRQSPRFGEAELLSQHVETIEDEAFTVFDLHVRWKI